MSALASVTDIHSDTSGIVITPLSVICHPISQVYRNTYLCRAPTIVVILSVHQWTPAGIRVGPNEEFITALANCWLQLVDPMFLDYAASVSHEKAAG